MAGAVALATTCAITCLGSTTVAHGSSLGTTSYRAVVHASAEFTSDSLTRDREGLRRLRVRDGRITDTRGRQVILRGVNVNQLGDYYAADPSLPTVVPLAQRDFDQIARAGFNHVRLIMSWSRLQPRRDQISETEIARIRHAVDMAANAGLYVVLDMHQDAWGKHIATTPGESCLPPLVPAVGWDGAPKWATITDGLSTCRLQQAREVSLAVAMAFQNFWIDRAGIQTEFLRVWQRLASEFGGDPAVAGYDILNEPHPGLLPGINQALLFSRFYRRAVDAVRAGESQAKNGFSHMVFFEPSVLWSGLGTDVLPLPGFTKDANVVFAPHLYAESITLDQGIGLDLVSIEHGWDLAVAAAKLYRTPLWVGEWGWFGSPQHDLAKVRRFVAQEDSNITGSAWWVWKSACGDPHVFGQASFSGSLHPLNCPSGTSQGKHRAYLRQITRTYPRYAPGELTSISSDPETGRAVIAGVDANTSGSCRLVVWVPQRGFGRPLVTGRHLRDLTVKSVPGGWLVTGCAVGHYRMRVQPARA